MTQGQLPEAQPAGSMPEGPQAGKPQGGSLGGGLVVVANWPQPRRHAWRTLLRARAIENLACVAAVNRVGRDGNALDYAGDSVVLDALGQPLCELGASEQVVSVRLDPQPLLAHRQRFPAWMDADAFSVSP